MCLHAANTEAKEGRLSCAPLTPLGFVLLTINKADLFLLGSDAILNQKYDVILMVLLCL